MKPRSKTYRNAIDVLLGITVADVAEIQKTSSLVKQRRKQKRRWDAHRARKAS